MAKTTMGLSDTITGTSTGTTNTLISSMSSTTPTPASTSASPSTSPAQSSTAVANDCSISLTPRKNLWAEIMTAEMVSGNRMSVESLPLEVIHQIFSHLPPHDLTSLRLTSQSLCFSATSNPHWRRHFTALFDAHAALLDVAAVPVTAWSFAHAPDGYFRAYTTLVRTARQGWLHNDEDLKGTRWMVLFKAFLKEGGARSDDPNYHTLIEMRADCTSTPIEGAPLQRSSWYVDGTPCLRFPCYPPNVPSRDPFTWCRVMQHSTVLMLTDSPDFLDNLIALNTSILTSSPLSKEQREARIKLLKEHTDRILEERNKDFFSRVKRLHHLRSDRNSRLNGCHSNSNAELPEPDGVVTGTAASTANEEVGKRLEP